LGNRPKAQKKANTFLNRQVLLFFEMDGLSKTDFYLPITNRNQMHHFEWKKSAYFRTINQNKLPFENTKSIFDLPGWHIRNDFCPKSCCQKAN